MDGQRGSASAPDRDARSVTWDATPTALGELVDAAGRPRPAGMLALQRRVGNRAVGGLIQTTTGATPSVPRLYARPGTDTAEREADRVAAATVGGTGLEATAGRDTASEQHAGIPAGVQSALGRRGASLTVPPAVRHPLERALDADLSDVRIHADAEAQRLSDTLGARAFTVGRDVFFAAGQYAPQRRESLALLAHEMAHVAQQAAGGPPTLQRKPGQSKAEKAVAEAISHLRDVAATILPEHLATEEKQQFLTAIGELAALATGSFGRKDKHGKKTQEVRSIAIEIPVTNLDLHVPMRSTYRHEFRLYLSDEDKGGLLGLYEAPPVKKPGLGTGELTLYLRDLDRVEGPASRADKLAAALVHEMTHLMTDVSRKARRYAEQLKPTPKTKGAAKADKPSGHARPSQRTLGEEAVARSIRLVNPPKHFRDLFLDRKVALAKEFEVVVQYLAIRSPAPGRPRDARRTAFDWAEDTADELMAYIFEYETKDWLQVRGAPEGETPDFEPKPYLPNVIQSYVVDHWVTDPAQKALLEKDGGKDILAGAIRSEAMKQLYESMLDWVHQRPRKGKPT